jgi:hypothetical protein
MAVLAYVQLRPRTTLMLTALHVVHMPPAAACSKDSGVKKVHSSKHEVHIDACIHT